MASPKNTPATYLVILVSTLPEPAPNRASVAAPPKAMPPMPASFLGNCSSTRKTSRTQSTNINTDNNINNIINSFFQNTLLYRVLDYIRETARVQCGSAHQRPIDIRLPHQFAGVGR